MNFKGSIRSRRQSQLIEKQTTYSEQEQNTHDIVIESTCDNDMVSKTNVTFSRKKELHKTLTSKISKAATCCFTKNTSISYVLLSKLSKEQKTVILKNSFRRLLQYLDDVHVKIQIVTNYDDEEAIQGKTRKTKQIVEPMSSAEYNDTYVKHVHPVMISNGQKESPRILATAYENPAFEGVGLSYDTFGDEEAEEQFNRISVASSEAPSVNIELGDEHDELTHELIDSLPSARLRQLRAMTSTGTVRFRKPDTPIHNIAEENVDLDTVDSVEVGDVTVQGLEADNPEQIRSMATTLERKKVVRMELQQKRMSTKYISNWKHFKYTTSMRFTRFKQSMKEAIIDFQIWQSHMRCIEGLFGTGALSYFTFLRWLLYLNLLVCLITLSFLFIPQLIYTQSTKNNENSFTGLELLTGEGWFTSSELYYGQYTNATINDKYDMKYAYLCVGGGYLLLCVIILAASMAKTYKENYINGSNTVTPFATKVFCTWDFAISNKESAQMKSQRVSQDLLETIVSEFNESSKRTCCQWFGVIMLRLFTNIVTLGLMVASAYLILYVSEYAIEIAPVKLSEYAIEGVISNTSENDLKQLLPAVTISSINWIIPSAFRMIASIEGYRTPKTQLNITLARTTILKLASLVVYVFALHKELTSTDNVRSFCWETYVGQAFYKLVIIDFLWVLISIIFGEFLRDVIAKHIKCCHTFRPGFDISKNVLNLIYAQGITCELDLETCLPFCEKKLLFKDVNVKVQLSIERNCRPSMRPFKASKMLVVFLGLLSLMLILSLIVIGYFIMEDDALGPSLVCGPFKGENSIYSVVWDIIDGMPSTLKEIVEIISSLSVLAAVLFLFCLLAYYFRMRKKSSEKKIKLLKHQLSLAGQDKQYLIKKLRKILTDTPVSIAE